jgi:chromosome segregation ATPase
MNRLFLAALLTCTALGASPALAASGLDAARGDASAARAKVVGIRERQSSLRQQMNQLAARIEALKTQQHGALLPGGELETSLRRSQELSGLLSDAARELSSAEADAQKTNLTLLATVSKSLDEAKARWEHASRDERRELVARMRALRIEREQVRAQLPAAAVPPLSGSVSDDPAEMLEQADAMRDAEDKVRQRMKLLETRIHELKDERDLDRRMSDFLGEESIFDEQDRRLRLHSDEQDFSSGRSGGINAAPGTPALTQGGADHNPGQTPGPGTFAPPQNGPNSSFTSAGSHSGESAPTPDGASATPANPDDLRGLERQLSNLGNEAKQLEERASHLEESARQLK